MSSLSRGMAYEISGTIKVIFDTQTFPSGFSKREFVITTGEKFPQDIKLECLKDKASMLENLKEGQPVKVQFDINGREYNGRYFVNLSAWRVEPAEGGSSASTASHGGNESPPDPEDTTDYASEDEPF